MSAPTERAQLHRDLSEIISPFTIAERMLDLEDKIAEAYDTWRAKRTIHNEAEKKYREEKLGAWGTASRGEAADIARPDGKMPTTDAMDAWVDGITAKHRYERDEAEAEAEYWKQRGYALRQILSSYQTLSKQLVGEMGFEQTRPAVRG